MKATFVLCLGAAILGLASQISFAEVAKDGIVLLTLRGPEGSLIADRDVQVAALAPSNEAPVLDMRRTDAHGQVRLEEPAGLRRLVVFAPGLGFGSTGVFEVLPDKSMEVPIPAFVPFAELSGSVAPELRKPGMTVRLQNSSNMISSLRPGEAPVLADGSFVIHDVVPEDQYLSLVGGQGAAAYLRITLKSGERKHGLVIKADRTPPAAEPTSHVSGSSATVHGTVTTSAGDPVAGADVYAVNCFWNIVPSHSEVATSKTDARGRYQIVFTTRGSFPGRISRVYAHRSGFPLAEFTASSGFPLGDNDVNPDAPIDLVIPAAHPGLTVRVRRGGVPVPGAVIHLAPESNPSISDYSPPGPASPRSELSMLLYPEAQTDAEGVARFTDLTPGVWTVRASVGEDLFIREMYAMESYRGNSGNVKATVAPMGTSRILTVDLFAKQAPLTFQMVGDPHSNDFLCANMLPALSSEIEGTGVGLSVLGEGMWQAYPPGAGLQILDLRTPDHSSLPALWRNGPRVEGRALFAVSPAMRRSAPPVIRLQPEGQGRITVSLKDAALRPVQGWVTLSLYASNDRASYSGATDHRGRVVFDNLPNGTYAVAAMANEDNLRSVGSDADPMPSNSELRGHRMFASSLVNLSGVREMSVTMRQQPAGYVRGRIGLRSADKLEEASGGFPPYIGGEFRVDRRTGEFVGGPLPGRTASLYLSLSVKRAGKIVYMKRTITLAVRPGEVVRRSEPIHVEEVINWVTAPVAGQVLQPDGVTPAWGAEAMLMSPSEASSSQRLDVDARGKIRSTGVWSNYSLANSDRDTVEPQRPRVVAWIPGVSGVVCVPYVKGQPVRLTLPSSIALHGRVTVAGGSVSVLTSQFHIRAAYQNHGRLNGLCSVETIADPDGSFTLAGLTPGTYQIQAARDGIWLSHFQTVNVGKENASDLTLDIGAAGAPVVLRLVDSSGAPARNQTVELRRPAGPLSDALWPKSLTTDSAGELRVEGLEAGPQAMVIPASSGNSAAQIVSLIVPAAGGADMNYRVHVKSPKRSAALSASH